MMKVELLLGQGALIGLPNLDKLRISSMSNPGVTLWVLRFIVERETAQTVG